MFQFNEEQQREQLKNDVLELEKLIDSIDEELRTMTHERLELQAQQNRYEQQLADDNTQLSHLTGTNPTNQGCLTKIAG